MSEFRGDWRHNTFVPSFAPQFEAMRGAGGMPGVSLENSGRQGVWVPLEWLDHVAKQVAAWKPYTAEELQFLYGRTQPTPEEQP
jgi:hypothetical protein